MNLEQALQIVDDKADVELGRLKVQYHNAVQRKFGERQAKGLLQGNGTAVVVKDELNRLINEKGGHFLFHYAQVLPVIDVADFGALEARLLVHFKQKLDFFYSEACHQLDIAKRQLRADDGGSIHLSQDYQNASRGWNADIKLLVGHCKASRMKTQPTIIYNFHGANARVNNNSVDASVNVVNTSEPELFAELKKALATIADDSARERLTQEAEALQKLADKASRTAAYLKFIEHAANHLTVLTPFLPALAQWAGQ